MYGSVPEGGRATWWRVTSLRRFIRITNRFMADNYNEAPRNLDHKDVIDVGSTTRVNYACP